MITHYTTTQKIQHVHHWRASSLTRLQYCCLYALSSHAFHEWLRLPDDGALPLDNNRCERAIRQVVMGWNTWLYAGSLQAGHRAAAVMSLLETERLNGVEPHGWLKLVLERLPSLPEELLHELLPFARNPLNN